MASSSVLSAQQAQVVANLAIVSGATSAVITRFILHPRIGPSQLMTLGLVVDTRELELEIVYHDDAFEQKDLFGGEKQEGTRQSEPGRGF